MFDLFKIAIRNLLRYKRRTLLTASLVTIGVVFVLVFVSVSASFKNMMIGQITDSFLGHIQIHKKGYVASICVCQAPIGPPWTPTYPLEEQTLTFQSSLLASYRHQRL